MNTVFKHSKKDLMIRPQNWDLGNLNSITYQKTVSLDTLCQHFLLKKQEVSKILASRVFPSITSLTQIAKLKDRDHMQLFVSTASLQSV